MSFRKALFVGAVLCWLPFAKAGATPPEKFLISVTSENSGRDHAWVEARCTTIHEKLVLIRARDSKVEAACVASNQVSKSGEYRLHISYREKADGGIRLEIQNWAADDTDYVTAPLDISPGVAEEQDLKLHKYLRNVLVYAENKRPFRELLLLSGVEESARVGIHPEGHYYDKQTFRKLSFQDAYEMFKEEKRSHKHYLRAATEIGVVLGLWTTKYYTLSAVDNRPDWEYKWDWENWRKRILGQSWRTDNNGPSVNRDHALAGAGYYWLGRSNGLNAMEAFLYSFTASAVWEFACEYKEKPSINDQIVTPVGGFAIGEVLFQLGDFFLHSEKNIVNRIFGGIFGSAQAFNKWLDGGKFKRSPKMDELGFRADLWHQFEFYVGYELNDRNADGNSQGAMMLGLHTRIFKPEDYDKAGQVRRVYVDPAFTEFMIQSTLNGQRQMDDFLFYAKSAIVGYYAQNAKLDEKQRLNGYSFFLAPSVAFEYRNTGLDEDTNPVNDWYVVVNVLGMTMDVSVYVKDVKIRFNLDVHGDFALIRSYAFPGFSEKHGTEGLRTVLVQQGYYFGKGVTSAGAISASYKGFEAGAQLKYHYIDSIEGQDRYQETVTNDTNLTDRVLMAKAWVAHPIYGKRVKAVYSAEYNRHTGTMGGHKAGESSKRYLGKIVFLF